MSDARLTEMEITLTHQAATIEELNTVAVEQAARLDRLERLVDALVARIADGPPEPAAPSEPLARPPHW